MRCEHYQDLLLDHLYGLLDEGDAAEVDSHLTGCAGCAAARHAAALTQGLLARAAKSSFPNVHFVPPDQAATVDLPATPERKRGSAVHPVLNGTHAEPAKSPPPARRALAEVSWGRWVVAASLLALIPAGVLPVSGWVSHFETAARATDRAGSEYADARSAHERLRAAFDRDRAGVQSALAAAKQKHDRLLTDWVEEERAAAQQAAGNRISVEVDRPAALQPGAPNEFVVSIRGSGRDAVEAEVRDQDGKVLFRQPLDHVKKGDTHPIRLPAEVWSRVAAHTELFLAVSKIDEKTGARTDLHDKVRLFGPVFTTLLVTDKPTYRPGERLFFRSLTLDRVSFRPPAHEQLLRYELRKIDNKADGTPVPGLAVMGSTEPARVADGGVDPVLGPDGKPVRGVGCGAFALPATLPDGDYVLMLTEQPHPAGYSPTITMPVKRTVRVRAGAVEQYQKKIGFAAAAYSPGEVVEAWAELKSNDKPAAGVHVEAAVIADNTILHVQVIPAKTRADGRVGVMFELPKELGRGDIKLLAKFKLPKGEEQVVEQVPLAGRDLVVEFFPEGGELVAGVPSRVYVRAMNASGRAVDVRGAVTDGKAALAQVSTPTDATEPGVNRGLGVFTITPQLGTTYTLKLDHPAKVATAFPLPKVRDNGVVMTVPDAVTSPGQAVRVQLHSVGRPRSLVVGAFTRGRLADTKRITAEAGKPVEVKLLTGDDPRGGVTRITVFEDPNENPAEPSREWVPVAERLVFRKPGEKLNLAFAAKQTDGQVDLSIAATDEKGNPAAAILWASVVNEAAVPGPRDRLMPTHFLLAGETESPDALEFADFLLTDHPRAAESLDMVLATQGWRRFVEQKQPLATNKELTHDAARLLVLNGQFPIGSETSLVRKHRELSESFRPRYEAAAKELEAAKKAAEVPADSRSVIAAKERADARRAEADTCCATLKAAAAPLQSLRGWAWFAVAGLVSVAAALAVLTCLRPNGLGGVLPLSIGGAAALGLAAYFGVVAIEPPPAANVSLAGDVTSDEPVDGDQAGRKVEPKPPGVERQPPVPPAVRMSPPKDVIPFAQRSQKAPHPVLEGVGQKILPDSGWGGRDVGVRAHVMKAFASDAADDPARIAAKKAAEERKQKFDEAVPALDPAAVERVRSVIPRMAPLVVREYAAPRSDRRAEPEADTVLWLPLIVLPTDGKTGATFGLGTGVSGYQVTIAGHTLDGRIGAVRGLLPVAPAAKTAPPPPVKP